MAIKPIVLQRRLAEVGRIRIGQVLPTASGKTRPAKLDKLRFTSASLPLIEQVAAAYGGEVGEWTPQNGGAAQWEVITDTDRVPVIVPPESVSQYMETWSGGGCQRRCDGETEMLSGEACFCRRQDNMVCKPTTRLSVMLRDIAGLGVWRLESHGWNAAAELPDTAEFLARAGGYIGAWLYLKPQRSVSNGQTRDWMVPALEVEGITPAQLLAGNGSPAALTGPAAPAIEAATVERDEGYIQQALEARTADAVREIYRDAIGFGHMHKALADQLTTIGRTKPAPPAVEAPAEQSEPAKPAEPLRSPDEIWIDIVNAAGEDWTLSALESAFASRNEGLTPADASAVQLDDFLVDLKGGWIKMVGPA